MGASTSHRPPVAQCAKLNPPRRGALGKSPTTTSLVKSRSFQSSGRARYRGRPKSTGLESSDYSRHWKCRGNGRAAPTGVWSARTEGPL